MELTDITKEEERKMQKNEKQVIAVLAAAIAVVAVIQLPCWSQAEIQQTMKAPVHH